MKMTGLSDILPSIVNFTDNEFHKTCFASFDQMRRNGNLCDVTLLSSSSRRFSAHKIVLAATIPFFSGMFLSKMLEVNKNEVALYELDPNTLEMFVHFAYTGSIQITPHNVQSLLVGASFLQLNNIRNICCRYIAERLSPSTVLTIRSFAQKFMCTGLVAACKNYICEHFEEVSQTDAFLSIDGSELFALLESDELCIHSEESLFHLIMNWVGYEDTVNKFGDSSIEQTCLPSPSSVEDNPCASFESQRTDSVHQQQCGSDLGSPFTSNLYPVEEPGTSLSTARTQAGHGHLHTKQSRIALLPELLKRIRLPLIPASFLSNVIAKHKLIRENLRCRDLVDEARDMLLLRDRPISCSFVCRPRRGQEVFGVIYAVSGVTASGECHGFVETYHPSIGRWELSEPMPSQCSRVGVATLNGLLYAVGGYDGANRLDTTQVYNPKTKVWKSVAPLNIKRSALSAASLDGRLYVCGGYDGVSSLRSCEMYDPKQDKWLFIPSMNEPRSAAALVALSDGCLYVVGGHNGLETYASMECFNPRATGPLARPITADANGRVVASRPLLASPWQPMASMNHRRCRHGMATLHNRIIVAGGYDGFNFLRSVEVFDPSAGPDANGLMGQWTEITSLGAPRSRVGLAVTGGRLYAIGGYDGKTHFRTVECFQPPLTSRTQQTCETTPREESISWSTLSDHISSVRLTNQNSSSSMVDRPDTSFGTTSREEYEDESDSTSTEYSSTAVGRSRTSRFSSQHESRASLDLSTKSCQASTRQTQGLFADWKWVPAASLIAHEGWVGVTVIPIDEPPNDGPSTRTLNKNCSPSCSKEDRRYHGSVTYLS